MLEDVDAGNPAALRLLPCCLPWALPLGCWVKAQTERGFQLSERP